MNTGPDLGPTTRWYHRGIFVILLLFFVLGPFALPLLWQSPDFKRSTKIIITVLLLAVTGWLIWRIAGETMKIVHQFQADAIR